MKGIITNIQRLSIHDGPGIRTTIFVKGCPLKCVWCDNPETVSSYPEIFFYREKCKESGKCLEVCPEKAITMNKDNKIIRDRCTLCMRCVEVCKYGALAKIGMEVDSEDMLKEVEKDIMFYRTSGGGMTLSGGEPLAQPDFVADVFRLCKQKFIGTTLDTSGYADLGSVEKVLRYTDLVLLDVKSIDPETHKKRTGVSNEVILKNAELMSKMAEVRISIPLIAGVNDSEANIRETCEFAKSIGVRAIDLLPMHKLATQKYRFLGKPSPYDLFQKITDKQVSKLEATIKSYEFETARKRSF